MKRLASTALALSLLTGSWAMADDRHDGDWRHDRSGEYRQHRSRDYGRDPDRDRRDDHYRGDYRRDWRDHSYGWRDDHPRPESHFYHDRDYNRSDDSGYRQSWGYRNDYRRPGYRVPRAYFYQPYVVDYRYYRLRPPPYGCHWVRMDRDLVLATLATGVVLDVLYNYF